MRFTWAFHSRSFFLREASVWPRWHANKIEAACAGDLRGFRRHLSETGRGGGGGGGKGGSENAAGHTCVQHGAGDMRHVSAVVHRLFCEFVRKHLCAYVLRARRATRHSREGKLVKPGEPPSFGMTPTCCPPSGHHTLFFGPGLLDQT